MTLEEAAIAVNKICAKYPRFILDKVDPEEMRFYLRSSSESILEVIFFDSKTDCFTYCSVGTSLYGKSLSSLEDLLESLDSKN